MNWSIKGPTISPINSHPPLPTRRNNHLKDLFAAFISISSQTNMSSSSSPIYVSSHSVSPELGYPDAGNTPFPPIVTLLGYFSFLLLFIPVLLLHLSHACVALRPLGLASSFLIAPVLLFAWHWLISWPWLVPSTATSSISLAWLIVTHY